MAINYADKYSAKIDERFKTGALTAPAINNDYDFTGVQTVKVYSIPTAGMNDYTSTGANRYGTPAELEDSVQELTLTKDRSFTFTIDKSNYQDTGMLKEAGAALQRQIDEVIIPELDIYRLAQIAAGAKNSATAAVTKANAYSAFLDGTEKLIDEKAPLGNRIAYVAASYFKLLKQDESFIKASELAQDMLVKGQVGMVDGIPIIVVPASYMPAKPRLSLPILSPAVLLLSWQIIRFMITRPVSTAGWLKAVCAMMHSFWRTRKVLSTYIRLLQNNEKRRDFARI